MRRVRQSITLRAFASLRAVGGIRSFPAAARSCHRSLPSFRRGTRRVVVIADPQFVGIDPDARDRGHRIVTGQRGAKLQSFG